MGAVRVGVAGPVKTRMVRLGFAKTSIQVLAFANPSWVVAGPTKTRVERVGVAKQGR